MEQVSCWNTFKWFLSIENLLRGFPLKRIFNKYSWGLSPLKYILKILFYLQVYERILEYRGFLADPFSLKDLFKGLRSIYLNFWRVFLCRTFFSIQKIYIEDHLKYNFLVSSLNLLKFIGGFFSIQRSLELLLKTFKSTF